MCILQEEVIEESRRGVLPLSLNSCSTWPQLTIFPAFSTTYKRCVKISSSSSRRISNIISTTDISSSNAVPKRPTQYPTPTRYLTRIQPDTSAPCARLLSLALSCR